MDELVFSTADPDLCESASLDDAVRAACRRDATAEARQREHTIDEATAHARAKAAAVTVAVADLVDAVAALQRFEGSISATWRQWVSWQCGLTSADTTRVCTLATKLPELPLIDAAFRAGEISDGVAALLAGIATPANEAAVLETTRCATGAQLQKLVRDFKVLERDTNAKAHDDEQPETARSEAWWGWDDQGRFRGTWDLRSDHGATLEAGLEALLADLRPTEADIDTNPVVDGELTREERSAVRKVDALVGLADQYLAAAATDGLLPESHQIILRRDCGPDGADAGPVDSLFPTILDGCGPIDRRLAETLSCDALTITQDTIAGFPISAPTTKRTFTRTQRRALRARDRSCRYPGCPRTTHLHAHHTKHWEHTHRTSVADGVLLCHQHHTLVHQRGHTLALETDGSVTVARADGTTLRGATPPPTPAAQHPRTERPADPPLTTRRTGAGEPLTHEARDTILTVWHHHTHRRPPPTDDDPDASR